MSALSSLAAARAALERDEADPESLAALAVRRNLELDRGGRPVRAFLAISAHPAGKPVRSVRAPRSTELRPRAGPAGDLFGVPVGVKDNLCVRGWPTTCASRVLADYHAPYEATAVRRLRAAGARIVGKTNLDEFGMGSSTETGAFGATRNPIDRSRVAGGSSGGSAAAVAAEVVPVALGSDTGGSVRQPAAFCGVVGVKPTYGRISRYGLVAFASSLDQVGVFARGVEDAAVVLEAISGPDARDATTVERPPPCAAALEATLRDRVLAVPAEYRGPELDDEVAEVFEAALERAASAGARIREVSLPSTPAAVPCYYVVAPAEAASNLARFDGVRYGRRTRAEDLDALYESSRAESFGSEVKRRILLGTYVLSVGYYQAYYVRAQRLRARIAGEIRTVLENGVDALFSPTTPSLAFKLGERTSDPYAMYRSDVYTVAANLAGLPAVSLPLGNAGQLPVGGQLICAPFEEGRLLGLALGLERALEYEHPLLGARKRHE